MDTDATRSLQREIGQTRPFRSPAQEATIAILRTADDLRRALAAVLEPHGITLQQYNVLRILRGAEPEPLSVSQIAERLIERTPGVTRLIDRLDAKGLVRRERSKDDRRVVHCRITEAGLRLLAVLEPEIDRADDLPMAELSEREIERLLEFLHRIRAATP